MIGLGEYVQVGTHDDEKVVPLGNFCFEELGVFDGLGRRMNGARTHDDEKAIIAAGEDPSCREACRSDRREGALGRDNLVSKKGRLNEWVVLNAKKQEMKDVSSVSPYVD